MFARTLFWLGGGSRLRIRGPRALIRPQIQDISRLAARPSRTPAAGQIRARFFPKILASPGKIPQNHESAVPDITSRDATNKTVVRRAKQGASYDVKVIMLQSLASSNYRVLR